MKSIRKSNIFAGNKRLAERKSIVGAFHAFDTDIFRDKIWYPHEEMEECVRMYDRNSFAQSAINTAVNFIKGGDLVIKSDDKTTKILASAYMIDYLKADDWIDEVIENTLKTGNGYLEIDYTDDEWKEPCKCYPLADSSRIYINCNEHGLPKEEKVMEIDQLTKEPKYVYKRNEKEYFVQRIDASFRNPKAKWFDMSYHYGSNFKKFRIYGLPIHKRKMIHFRLNLGNSGVYGRSYMASALDDDESLRQMERSLAIIAKYKAVPRDVIMYGDKDNPATDDELDDFIIYLESLEKDESAIVNKPIKRESLSYSGQDINLDYMIKHVSQKIVAGIAPDFLMGVGDQASKANAQIRLISYILAIYSKRKLFLKPLEECLLKPFLKKYGLKKAWLEFGELDFETKNEKVNRIGSMWTQNLITFNEARQELGLDTKPENGDSFYLEWQNSMMDTGMGDGGGFNFPTAAPQGAGSLPNGESPDKVFDHNSAPNRKPPIEGGKMPFDPYQKKTDVPKFLQKGDIQKPGESYSTKDMPESYDLNSSEATITIDIPDGIEAKTKQITFDVLMGEFANVFMEPRQVEVYYKVIPGGWKVSFNKNDVLIYCNVMIDDILNSFPTEKELSQEEKNGIVQQWVNNHLIDKGIAEV